MRCRCQSRSCDALASAFSASKPQPRRDRNGETNKPDCQSRSLVWRRIPNLDARVFPSRVCQQANAIRPDCERVTEVLVGRTGAECYPLVRLPTGPEDLCGELLQERNSVCQRSGPTSDWSPRVKSLYSVDDSRRVVRELCWGRFAQHECDPLRIRHLVRFFPNQLTFIFDCEGRVVSPDEAV